MELLGERIDTHTERLHNILQNRPQGMHLLEKLFCSHCLLLMIVNDFNVVSFSVLPMKADPPLIVDPTPISAEGKHCTLRAGFANQCYLACSMSRLRARRSLSGRPSGQRSRRRVPEGPRPPRARGERTHRRVGSPPAWTCLRHARRRRKSQGGLSEFPHALESRRPRLPCPPRCEG